jgi:hypothetical protein
MAAKSEDMSGVGAFHKLCEKYHPAGRCEKAEIPVMKAEEAADWSDRTGAGPMCKMCKSHHPMGKCVHQKSEDYIDMARAATPKDDKEPQPRIKEVPTEHQGKLPGD